MLKIIITGPESSGKTTLAKALAKHFDTPLVEEYVREFFEKKQTPQYVQSDLTKIAIGQIENEKLKTQNEKHLLICDTDILTIKIWSDVVFKNCQPKLMQLFDNHFIMYHSSPIIHYFLCSPEGIEWEYDPLRENPHDRDRLFKIYKNELKKGGKNFDILRGSFEERLQNAIKRILILKSS